STRSLLQGVSLGPQPMFAARPLHPWKRTCRARLGMSQKCHERSFPPATLYCGVPRRSPVGHAKVCDPQGPLSGTNTPTDEADGFFCSRCRRLGYRGVLGFSMTRTVSKTLFG